MNRAKLSAKGLLLISGIGVAAAALAGPALAAVQPSSGTSTPTTVVIRGSDPAAAEPSSASAHSASRHATCCCTASCCPICLPFGLRLRSELWLCHARLRLQSV